MEVCSKVTVLATQGTKSVPISKRFERYSDWKSLTKAMASLTHLAKGFAHSSDDGSCVGWHSCKKGPSTADLTKAKHTIIRCVQQEAYSEEFKCIEAKQNLPGSSALYKLHPLIDSEGLLRVGGRLTQAKLQKSEANPLIIPDRHHVATLLIHHHHECVQHQGRHLTEGAICVSGLWIVGAKRCISGVLHKCVICRKLRGRTEQQQMLDLPAERLQTDPPFSYVALDVFGSWEVAARRTRGGHANSKRWALLFTCMSTRAIHIEVIETMSSSSFINALRRFFSIRCQSDGLLSSCALTVGPTLWGQARSSSWILQVKGRRASRTTFSIRDVHGCSTLRTHRTWAEPGNA